MNSYVPPVQSARVASLHLHPVEPGAPLQTLDAVEVVAGKGVLNDSRYFGRPGKDNGQPSRRQVSLIEREQIAEHAAKLGLPSIVPGAVRANIEMLGVSLVALVGKSIQIGDAVLFLYEPRKPCAKMDAICQGLRSLMMDNQQGVMAEVVKPGRIRVGDRVSVLL